MDWEAKSYELIDEYFKEQYSRFKSFRNIRDNRNCIYCRRIGSMLNGGINGGHYIISNLSYCDKKRIADEINSTLLRIRF